MRRARRETAVSRCTGTTRHPYIDLPDDRLFGAVDADVETHTDACALRRISLHGSRFIEGSTVLRQDTHHADAGQVSTGLHVPPAGTLETRPSVHRDTIGLSGLFVDHQVFQQYVHFVPIDGKSSRVVEGFADGNLFKLTRILLRVSS